MARAIKSTAEDVARGDTLPPAATTTYDAFIVENTLDPVGEPNGHWYRTNGNWVRGSSTGGPTVAGGNTLPLAATATHPVFIIENSLDPIGEPDGMWFLTDNNWVLVQAA